MPDDEVSGARVSSNQLQIRQEQLHGAKLLALRGELDIATSSDLDERLQMFVEAASEHLLIDLSALSFMDSMGLQVLLRARRKLGRQGRELVLVCPPGPILRLLVVTNLETAFNVHPDREAAERSLRR
jgi:anti-sigma B factor antagonist